MAYFGRQMINPVKDRAGKETFDKYGNYKWCKIHINPDATIFVLW
jgi:hypothetical protein